ncbi:MAG: hypothetical protein E6J28_11730 [Chloroflexi bacterium]|nr:MAG: hypothetical protein E6J28_11730 [Chloroflexota bacterium]
MSTEAEDFGPSGALLWHGYVDQFEMDPGELAALRQACQVVDELDRVQSLIRKSAPLVTGSVGQLRENPLYAQAREHRKVLIKLLATIKVPSAAPGALTGNVISLAAREAARARWRKAKNGAT